MHLRCNELVVSRGGGEEEEEEEEDDNVILFDVVLLHNRGLKDKVVKLLWGQIYDDGDDMSIVVFIIKNERKFLYVTYIKRIR